MDPKENAGSKKMEIFKSQGTYWQETLSSRPTWLVLISAQNRLCEKQVHFHPGGFAEDQFISPDATLPVCCVAVLMSLGVTVKVPGYAGMESSSPLEPRQRG